MTIAFSVNFDYRCPFARNAHEHVVAALRAGADYDAAFKGFSLTEAHIAEGELSAFDDPGHREDLIALAAGIVVRDRFPDHFLDAHLSLFAIRHDDGDDLRDEAVVRDALARVGVDADLIFSEIESGWPIETIRAEHEASVKEHSAFGVPTFIAGDQAAFVRLMTRPNGDGELAKKTIDKVLELLIGSPGINEFKHTSVPR
ncbi:MAG TPA: DsbA family protein [Acidimicrobiales bacterium]|nr:DsbA family protein [Acidimicrobiales bacterium]